MSGSSFLFWHPVSASTVCLSVKRGAGNVSRLSEVDSRFLACQVRLCAGQSGQADKDSDVTWEVVRFQYGVLDQHIAGPTSHNVVWKRSGSSEGDARLHLSLLFRHWNIALHSAMQCLSRRTLGAQQFIDSYVLWASD